MRKLLGLLLLLLPCGACAPMLGAHVHKFSYAGTDFVKCTVIVDPSQHALAEQSLQVCRDAIGVPQGPTPARRP